MRDFRYTKWNVSDWSKEMKAEWQEFMFSLGYKWAARKTQAGHLDSDFYFINKDCCITKDDDDREYFDECGMLEQVYSDALPNKPLNPLGTFCEPETESSGGSCNYYMVDVKNPTTLKDPYTIECNDLIESLGLSFKEANIIKEIFRTANERTNGNGKPGNTEKRAAEKVLFFAIRHAISNGVDIEKFTREINLK